LNATPSYTENRSPVVLDRDVPILGAELHADVATLGINGQPNPDGVINVGDALAILRKAVGLIAQSNIN
jgi:hypothetical protein